MKKGQKITRNDENQLGLNYRYDYQDYDVCIKVNKKSPTANKVKKKNGTMIKAGMVLFVVLLMTIIANNCIESKAENRELEAYHAEQFEKIARNEFEEAGGQIEEKSESNFSLQNTRVEIESTEETKVVLEETPKEDLPAEEVEVTNEEVIETIEEVINTTAATEEMVYVFTEEYKPVKLTECEISFEAPYDYYVYILSEEDKKYIAKLVWQEARGETYEGMVAVAAVVLNRYFSDDPFFDRRSMLHILTQPTQFATIWGVTDWHLSSSPDCLKAVEDACKGWDPTREVFEEGALYFYNPDGVSGYQAAIREGIKTMEIGNHAFHYDFEKVEE